METTEEVNIHGKNYKTVALRKLFCRKSRRKPMKNVIDAALRGRSELKQRVEMLAKERDNLEDRVALLEKGLREMFYLSHKYCSAPKWWNKFKEEPEYKRAQALMYGDEAWEMYARAKRLKKLRADKKTGGR